MPQKYREKTLHQSLWGVIRGRRSRGSHSDLQKHKIVVEDDIGDHWCRFHHGMRAETLNTLTESVRSLIFTRSYSKPMIISPVSFMECKSKIFVSRRFSTRYFYCLLFSLFCFRLNSSMRNKNGTDVFWEMECIIPESLRALTR